MRALTLTLVLFLLSIGRLQATDGNKWSPGGYFDNVYDRFGNKYALGEIAIDDGLRYASIKELNDKHTPSSLVVATCTSGHFRLYLDNSSGMENFASDPVHAARLNVLCKVLQDLSAFIQSPLSTTGNKVNIWVRNPASTGATGGVLGLATPFYYVPGIASVSGIADNMAWITINSGNDAFTNVISPLVVSGGGVSGATFFHGQISFNFSGTTFHTDLATPPAAGKYDLYTVALHECMHMLGFASHISANGETFFGMGLKYYSRYDRHLKTASGTNLITQGMSSCSMYDWQFNSILAPVINYLAPVSMSVCTAPPADHTNCATAIKYVDGIIAEQPVYTPDCFQVGGSLSHFEDECAVPASFGMAPPASNNHYFVMSNSGAAGPYSTTNRAAMKRYPTPEERQVFCDIGYKVASTFGDAASLNSFSYTGGVCGVSVAGINDGITTAGGFAYNGLPGGPAISINAGTSGANILGNDGGADRFECLQVVVGAGILSATMGSAATPVSYIPATGDQGVLLLRYIPYNLASGKRGNITYVYINIDESGSCPAEPCNMIRNGNFENAVPGSVGIGMAGLQCWRGGGTPDLFSTGFPGATWGIPNSSWFTDTTDSHPLSDLPNDHWLGMGANITLLPTFVTEIIFQSLATPILSNTAYTVSFWMKMCNKPTTMAAPGYLQFSVSGISPLVTVPDLIPGPIPGLTPFCAVRIGQPDDNWHYYSQTVTPVFPAGFSGKSIAVYQAPWLDTPPSPGGYIALDDLKVVPAASSCSFAPPAVVSALSSAFDLSAYVSVPGPAPEFRWRDTSGIVTSNMFNPTSAYLASVALGGDSLVTVSYSYGASWCRQTVYAQITLSNNSGLGTGILSAGMEKVYPNPVSGILTIESQISCSIVLSDCMGRHLMKQSGKENVQTIDMSELSAGVYFLQLISDDGERKTIRLLKK